MSTSWKEDKRWGERFLPEIKRILGEYLISEPPIEEDTDRNTDLIVLKLDAIRIACRVRKASYLEKYSSEFTIRAGRPSGVKTELTKIVEGWGQYLFYGFSNPEETALVQWVLIDLNAFRLWFMKYLFSHHGKIPGAEKLNTDGSSTFRAFDTKTMPINIIVASSKVMTLCT